MRQFALVLLVLFSGGLALKLATSFFSAALAFTPAPIQCSQDGPCQIIQSRTPFFQEVGWSPGSTQVVVLPVENQQKQTKYVSLRFKNLQDNLDLHQVLQVEVFLDSPLGKKLVGPVAFDQVVAAPTLLSRVAARQSSTYFLVLSLPIAAEPRYQTAQIQFDLGIESHPSKTLSALSPSVPTLSKEAASASAAATNSAGAIVASSAAAAIVSPSPSSALSTSFIKTLLALPSLNACFSWAEYLPWFLLIVMIVAILWHEYIHRQNTNYLKHLITLGIAIAVVCVFYLLKPCVCKNDELIKTLTCKWFFELAAVVALLCRAFAYAFLEEVSEPKTPEP